MNQKIVLITGISGFLGSHLASNLRKRGWDVRGLTRDLTTKELPECKAGIFHFDLDSSLDEKALEVNDNVETILIHCAYAMGGKNARKLEELNYQGTMKLFQLWRKKHPNSKFVYISSMAAHSEAKSSYGKGKFRIELELSLRGALIIKPGTIVGRGGLFQRLTTLAKTIPIMPVFFPKNFLQIVDIDDLTNSIAILLETNASGIFPLAHPEPISIYRFYQSLLDTLGLASKRVLVPLPGNLLLPFLRLAERLGFSLPVTSENLLGLKHVKYFDTKNTAGITGVKLKTYEESLKSHQFNI